MMSTLGVSIWNPLLRLLRWLHEVTLQGNDLTEVYEGGDLRPQVTYRLGWLKAETHPAGRAHVVSSVHKDPRGAVETPCSLEKLEARLEALLAEMEACTGCSDAKAERLLAEWAWVNAEYTSRRRLHH